MKHKACDKVGIRSVGVVLKDDVTTEDVIAHVNALNADASVDAFSFSFPPFRTRLTPKRSLKQSPPLKKMWTDSIRKIWGHSFPDAPPRLCHARPAVS